MLTVAWVAPFPPDHNGGGGQIRQAHLLTELAHHAAIHLICPGPLTDAVVQAAAARVTTVPAPRGWREDHPWWRRLADLAAVGGSDRPMEVRAFGPLRRALRPALAQMAADVVLVEYAGLAPLLPVRREGPWILTFHNLPSRMAAHEATIQPRGRQRWLLERDARIALAFERRAVNAFDAIITCTAADAAVLAGEGDKGDEGVGGERGEAAGNPRIAVVPNGTDVDRIQPTPVPVAPRIVFTGALYTTPNVDGAAWFCREVLPFIRQAEPSVALDIVGGRPGPQVRALGDLPGVTVHADVADVSVFLRPARVAVVPIRVGSGSRLKALEALAAGRPVVGTTIGLEGLDLQAGKEVLVADDPSSFAAAVVRLLRDDELATSLAQAGRLAVEQRFAWPAMAAGFVTSVVDIARVAP